MAITPLAFCMSIKAADSSVAFFFGLMVYVVTRHMTLLEWPN